MLSELDWPALTQFAPGQRFANFTARVTSPQCSKAPRKSGVTTEFYISSVSQWVHGVQTRVYHSEVIVDRPHIVEASAE
jgi:hypothetical protein